MKACIREIKEKNEKMEFIQACDSSFTLSVINRKNFNELFHKIHMYAVFLGLEYDTKCAGYAALYANDKVNYTAFITLICIAEKYQRMHLGSALMRECIRIAQEANMKKIQLKVLKEDIHAIAFYKSFGFQLGNEASKESFYMYRSI